MRPQGRYTQSTAEKVCEEKKEREGKVKEEKRKWNKEGSKEVGMMGKNGDKFDVQHDRRDDKKVPGMKHCQNKRKGVDGVGKKLKRRVCHRKSMKNGVRKKLKPNRDIKRQQEQVKPIKKNRKWLKMEERTREIGNQEALWVQKGDRKNKD